MTVMFGCDTVGCYLR